ncbi:MAG: PEP-CTERM sorting domain-containing protein [Rubrivivax sp.]|nr:MAG: PEP-CTERM sorting domain-containing protein [Rubrivivax sp.]
MARAMALLGEAAGGARRHHDDFSIQWSSVMSAPRFSTFTLTAIVALAAALAQPAQAGTFLFTQGGYAEGATVTGHFSGSDLDGDGWLHGYELTDFQLSWSGNRAVESFSLGFDDRSGLEYELSTGSLAHMAGVSQNGEGVRYFSYDSMGWPSYQIPGTVTDERLGLASMTWEPLQVTAAVPEPHSLALLMGGLAFIGLWSQRRRAA